MTATNRMPPVHPGEILREEMDERDLSRNALAQAPDIPANRIAGFCITRVEVHCSLQGVAEGGIDIVL